MFQVQKVECSFGGCGSETLYTDRPVTETLCRVRLNRSTLHYFRSYITVPVQNMRTLEINQCPQGWLVGWLVGWLFGWLVGRLVIWLVGW